MNEKQTNAPTRRGFLKGAAAFAAAPIILPGAAPGVGFRPSGSDQIKVGLVGCGGRGTGAALQALRADKGAVLWAVADTFADRTATAVKNLEEEMGDEAKGRFMVGERSFHGVDGYKDLIASGVDVVLLATPTVFRPMHLKACVEAGKHVFCEKPMAVDAVGCRSVMETVKLAKEKKLSLVAGFCWRRASGERAIYREINEGRIGEVRASYNWYVTGPVRTDPRKKEWSDLEFQLRNWYHFIELGGDMIVEQACHSVDKMMWAMKDVPPARAIAVGGRAARDGEVYGNSYDHFAVTYEWNNGARGFLMCRQIAGCFNENKDLVMGAKGVADVDGWKPRHEIRGENPWLYKGPQNDMYQQEHDELFAAIRKGEPINDGDWMMSSTLAAIQGRMAAYTGAAVTWKMALESKEDLTPKDWTMGPRPQPTWPVPGKTKFV
jgi:myo-inositol 2-dehydrogenase/D-chiro-inositol 1-dehydrogenase